MKLRMCPHCGNQNVLPTVIGGAWQVQCSHCLATGPAANTRDEAVQFWNSGYPTAYPEGS